MGLESFHVREHIHIRGAWCTPTSWGQKLLHLRPFWTSFFIYILYYTCYNKPINVKLDNISKELKVNAAMYFIIFSYVSEFHFNIFTNSVNSELPL